jgi:hypothetical protein
MDGYYLLLQETNMQTNVRKMLVITFAIDLLQQYLLDCYEFVHTVRYDLRQCFSTPKIPNGFFQKEYRF